ncbi:MAG: LytTR family DNA-binding domain-containing protein [Bacteroidota bacterium]|nr:LytTR family DNA-binding domain-containing protein [Bacteroidota bacterium]
MVKCIVVDDEPLAQQVLEAHILKTKELHLVKKCANAVEAFEILGKEKIDLMFLDIKMPNLSGTDFILSLRNPPAVVFTTAFSEYAALSYELEAIDYLLKPVTLERFNMSIARFLKTQIRPEQEQTYSYFKVDGKLVKIEHTGILYAQAIKDYIILCTLHGNYIVHMTMKGLEDLLPANLFVRIHRSFIIGTSHIRAIEKSAVELGKMKIPIGGNYKLNVDLLKTRISGL